MSFVSYDSSVSWCICDDLKVESSHEGHLTKVTATIRSEMKTYNAKY